jgi:tetratricopeptide (TPR) repeat protein
MKRYLPFTLLFAALFVFAGRISAGENDGQDDLDKATEKKLSSESLDDLSDVLKLCESAMKKGLSPANTQFANDLYTSTLLQRGTVLTQAVFDRRNGAINPRSKQLRETALADLEKVVTRDPKSGTAQLMIAKLQGLPGGDREKALKAADQAVTLINKAEEPALAAAALVVRASVLDDPKKEEADLVEALKLKPDDLEALRTRALFYIGQKKYEPALTDLDALIRAEGSNPRLFEVRGMVLFQLKQPEKAIESFNKAIQLQPGQVGPYIARARARSQMKDTKGALEDLETALKIEPDSIAVLLARARVYQQTGDLKSAKADVEAALKNRPDLPDKIAAETLLASIAAGAGDIDEAIAESEHLLEIMPKNPTLLFQIGILYTLNKQSRKAIEKFTDALANSEKKDFNLYRHRGDAYLNVGKHAEAVKDYEEAFKLKPSDSGLLNNFAWVLATSPDEKLRDGKRSVEMGLKACQETRFEQPHILSTLAAGYAESGDFENAVKYSTKAVEVAAAQPDTADIKEQLQKELDSYKQKKPVRELLTEDDAAKSKPKDKKPADADNSSDKKKPDEGKKPEEGSSKANDPEKPAEAKKPDDAKNADDAKKP